MALSGGGEAVRRAGEGGVSNRNSYRTHGLQLVDEKARVAIPSALRAALLSRSPVGADGKPVTNIVIQTHERLPCLCGYDLEYADELQADLEARARAQRDETGAPNDDILRNGMVSDVLAFDGSGRFILPRFPRKYAHIGQYAFFHGMGRYFELWDPATLLATEGVHNTLKLLVRDLLDEREERA